MKGEAMKLNKIQNSIHEYAYGQWLIRKRLDGPNNKIIVWRGIKRYPRLICEEFTLKQLCQTIQKHEEESVS